MAHRAIITPPRPEDTSLDWLVKIFKEYLHLPDPGALYVLLGAVAANLMEGDPVWLMLVGPASCGKTELLNSLLSMRHVFECASISNEAAFLSATAKKERSREATGGLLCQVGTHGAVMINDFTSILSMDAREMKKILGVFRECYQGRWTRHVGAEGGRQMQWSGRVAFFAGCTGAIDRYHEASASLGERWVYYRMVEEGSFERSRRTLLNASMPGWRDHLKDAVEAFFTAHLGLEFGQLEARRELTLTEMDRLIRMATVGARCRSAVIRDSYTKEIVSARESEQETRISAVLGQLLVGMERVGIKERDRWQQLGKLVLDSMPKLRLLVLQQLHQDEKDQELTRPETLVKLLKCSRSTVDRTIEDLWVHGIVRKERIEGSNKVTIHLTDWMRKEWQAGWKEYGWK